MEKMKKKGAVSAAHCPAQKEANGDLPLSTWEARSLLGAPLD